MKRNINTTFFLITILIFVAGCSDSGSKKNDLEQFKWLIGSWTDTTNGFFENWTLSGDSALTGYGLQILKGDTIFEESLTVKKVGHNWSYIVRYGSEETVFPLSNVTGDSLVFVNPGNEFPKRISYIKKTDGSIMAVVENPGETDKISRYNFVPLK